MKTHIVRIGNSKGIRIPKLLRAQAQLPEDVALHAEPGRLVVRVARGCRFGWAERQRQCAPLGKTAWIILRQRGVGQFRKTLEVAVAFDSRSVAEHCGVTHILTAGDT